MASKAELPLLQFASQREWEKWLEKNHGASAGVWLKLAKKEAGEATVSYAEALEIALCYGWIDGQKGAVDAAFWKQRFTPRGPRSKWSKINREKAEALIQAKRMKPAGLREVEQARDDGRWEAAYASQSKSTVPEDLQQALDRNPKAKAFFATISSANRYAILYRIHDAKKPETRAQRITKFVDMLNAGKTIH